MKKRSVLVKLRSVIVFALLTLFAVSVASAEDKALGLKLGEPIAFGQQHTILVSSVVLNETTTLSCVFITGKSASAPSITKCFSTAAISVSDPVVLDNSHVAISILAVPTQAKPVLCVFQTGEDEKAPISYDCQQTS